MKLKKLIMIWFTVGIVCAFLGFGAVVTPGVNFVAGIPTILFIMAVNMGFFIAVMWKWANAPPSLPKLGGNKSRGGGDGGCVECCNGGGGGGGDDYGDGGYDDYGDDGYDDQGGYNRNDEDNW